MLKYITPTSLIGKIGLWGMLYFAGFSSALWYHECPPTTSVAVKSNNKVKKGSNMVLDLTGQSNTVEDTIDCDEWLRGLSMKDVRAIRK